MIFTPIQFAQKFCKRGGVLIWRFFGGYTGFTEFSVLIYSFLQPFQFTYIFAILQNVGANHRKYQVVIVIKQKTSSSTFLSDVSEFCEFWAFFFLSLYKNWTFKKRGNANFGQFKYYTSLNFSAKIRRYFCLFHY